jgi:hypothetical protein
LQGDALLGELFLLEQNNKPTLPAALLPMLPTLPALLHTSPCARALSGVILSHHAQHEQQRFLFLTELLV